MVPTICNLKCNQFGDMKVIIFPEENDEKVLKLLYQLSSQMDFGE